jgi:hypothetical protein
MNEASPLDLSKQYAARVIPLLKEYPASGNPTGSGGVAENRAWESG